MRWIHCLFDNLTSQYISWCNYNKCFCHHISLERATILLSNFFLIFNSIEERSSDFFKAKLLRIRVISLA